MTTDHYNYRVSWSSRDAEYVATCTEFPSLSWLNESEAEALSAIKRLVQEVCDDLRLKN